MTKVCIVCGNRASDTDREIVDPLQKVTYHKIPISGERNKKWLEFCHLSKKVNINNKFVCSEHFDRKCLERDLKSELLDGVKRMILKKDAIPTIKKPKKHKRKNSQELEEEQRKKRKEEVEKLLSGELPKPILNPFRPKQVETKQVSKPDNKPTKKSTTVQLAGRKTKVEIIEALPDKSDSLEKQISLEHENRVLKMKVSELEQLVEKKNEKINLAKTEMLNITIALQELKDIENRNLNIRVNELLKGTFTANQIRRLLGNAQNIVWNNEEMTSGLMLRLFGEEIYDYVYDQLRYPLPSAQDMEQWVKECYLQTGLLIPVLGVLQALGRRMDLQEKDCVLLLGRTKANPKFCYDAARDQIIDNDGYLYCICVQGILSNWHQIIYIDFDLVYSADLLVALVNELYDIQFNVVAISGMCDQETSDLWNELGVTPEHHFIKHPKTAELIYMLTCPISTFAVIHEVLIEGGFIVQDDVLVTNNVLEKLFDSSHPGIHEHLEISQQHLSLHAFDDHNIQMTKELISHNTTKALKILSEEGEEAVAVLATLFEVFRDWYDLFTTLPTDSTMEKVTNITHQNYGVSLDEQNIVLDGMYDTFESLRCANEKYSYLHGCILVSINSLRKLLVELRKSDHHTSIPTIKLTTLNLNEVYVQLRTINKGTFSSVNKILYQLSTAIADGNKLSMTNRILEEASLKSGLGLREKQDSLPDKDIANISEKEACSFLAGYIANALKEKYDYLGDQTFVIERKNNSYVVMPEMPTGVIEPSRLWMEQARKLESYVSDLTFYKNESVIENVVNSISKRHPKMGVDIIRLYVKKRIMIKLNNLNKDLEHSC